MLIEKSFGLIRTNPALTSNVKIVVTSDYNIYLESFQINKGLSEDRYKHFEVKKTDYLNESLYYFFKEGVPLEQVFNTPSSEDADEMYDDFKNQYDDTYLSGASWAEDTWYTEEYEYLAPLYINTNNLPKHFIILRVDGPGLKLSEADNFRADILDQWKFIQKFDLTEATGLGRWIKSNLTDPDFPEHPLIIKHDEGDYSEISGINIEDGGWVTKTIDLIEEQRVNTPIFKTEELITQSFQRNNIVYPNILNFKFLFDDTPATPEALRKYSINRYLGFYVDDLELVKTVTPHQPFDLNKVPDNLIETLSALECDEIPYVKDNIFVRDIKGRSYSFDPIKNGWDDKKVYWVEFKQNFYRLEKTKNTGRDIIGDFLYRIISNVKIERDLDTDIQNLINNGLSVNPEIIRQQKKVIINDISTMKDRVEILPKLVFPNFQATNIIRNINPNFVTYNRNFVSVIDDGITKYVFTLSLDNDINNNLFQVTDYATADLHLVEIGDMFYVLKRYPANTPNVEGLYYLHTDWAIEANQKNFRSWINNGNLSKNSEFYNETSVEETKGTEEPIKFNIYRVKFTDIKDFDFDRVETKYSDFEYEFDDTFTETLEPKFYAKEHRKLTVDVKRFPKDYVQRKPVLDLNNETYDPPLFQNDYNNDVIFTDDTKYQSIQISLPREYYREENYLYLVDGDPNKVIDFITNSDPVEFREEPVFGTAGYSIDEIKNLPLVDIWPDQDMWQDIVGKKKVIDSNGKSLPSLKAKRDPNENYDPNYVPVTSEYITTNELFEVRGLDLSPIWSKTPTVCKWGLVNSLNSNEYPYRLNYDLEIGGLDNRSPNIYSNLQYPLRSARDLDYFYRFGLVNKQKYKNYSLHLKDSYFDIDKYFSTSYDYFEGIMKSDQLTSDGIKLTQKYSVLHSGAEFLNPYTVFRGMRYNIGDVDKIQSEVFFNTDTNTNQTYIEDIFTKSSDKYNGYRFSIIMGRKLSAFNNNPGRNNGNFGVDVYLNDVWKNIIIHIYFETDEVLQIDDPSINSTRLLNAETCVIDKWYQDKDIARTDLNALIWDKLEFKINGQGIGIRPRDLRMIEIMTILNNLNYRPDLSVEGETRNPVNFIHIYNDGTSKIMTNENTDFHIRTELPSEFLIKEKGYSVEPIKADLDINNTVRNTMVLDDDPNNPLNDPNKTFDGVQVGVVPDINAYNEYPFAFNIDDANLDSRFWYELEEGRDPEIRRYEGPYVPIFRNVDLFRPLNYLGISHGDQKSGNYKFYDPRHAGVSTNTLATFGYLSELIFSKVNRAGSILKLNDPNGKYHSVFPMVDECGYSYIPKYMFQSNWDPEFYLESKKRIIPKNEYPGVGGFTVHFSAEKDKIVVPDMDKFNYFIDGYQDGNIDMFDETELRSGWQSGSQTSLNNIEFDIDASNGLARVGYDSHRSENAHHFIFGPYISIKPGKYTITFRIKVITSAAYTDETVPLFVLDVVDDYGSTAIATDTITGSEIPVANDYNDYILEFNTLTYLDRAEFRIEVVYPANVGHVIYCDYITCQREEVIITSQFYNNPSISGYAIPETRSLVPGMYYRFKYTGTGMSITGTNVYKNNTLATLIGNSPVTISTPTEAQAIVYIPISYYPNLIMGNYVKYFGTGNVSQVEVSECTPYVDIDFKNFGTSGHSMVLEMKKDSDDKYATITIDDIKSVTDLASRLRAAFSNFAISPSSKISVKNRSSLYNSSGSSIYNVSIIDAAIDKAKIKIHLTDQFNPSTDYNFKIRPKKTKSLQPDYNFVYRDFQVGTSNTFNPNIKLKGFYSKPLKFDIIPDNFSPIKIDAQTIYTTNNNHIPVGDIINQINNDLVGLPFTATLDSSDSSSFTFYITSDNNGSYYNFSIVPGNVKSYTKKIKMIGRPLTILRFGHIKVVKNGHFINIKNDHLRPVRGGILKPVILKAKEIILHTQPIVIPKVGFMGAKKIAEMVAQQNAALIARQASINALQFKSQKNEVARDEKSVAIIDSSKMDTTLINEVVSCRHVNLQKSKVGYTNSFTIEFWVFIGGWVNTNETIMYKGLDGIDVWTESTLYKAPNFTWAIGRDGNNNRLSFRTCHIKPALLKRLVVFKTGQPLFIGQIVLFENVFYDVIANVTNPTTFNSVLPVLRLKSYSDVVDVHTLNTDKELNDDQWHHVAFTFDGDVNQKTVYIDGLIEAQYKDDEPLLTNVRTSMTGAATNKDLDTWNILIGTDSVVNNGIRNFLGSVDEIRIWNYARNRDEIYNNHRLILNKTSYLDPSRSLIFYMRLDEGKGVNTFSDLMTWDKYVKRGWLVEDIDRYQISSLLTEDNGKNKLTTNDVSVRQFVSSWDLPELTSAIPSSREILVNDSNVEWIVSGADIQGGSDERYVGIAPPASITQKNTEVPKIIVPKSKYVLKEPPKPIPARIIVVRPHVIQTFAIFQKHINLSVQKPSLLQKIIGLQPKVDDNPFRIFGLVKVNKPIESWFKKKEQEVKIINTKTVAGIKEVAKSIFNPFKKKK